MKKLFESIKNLLYTKKNILFFVLLLIIVLLGIIHRLNGYFTASLYVDEAWRATFIFADDWFKRIFEGSQFSVITSIGYIIINRILAIFINIEPIIKLSSLIPSFISIYLFYLICIKLNFNRFIQLFGVFIISSNAVLIQLTKEFKPYSLEICIYLLVIFLILKYIELKSLKSLIILLSVSFISILFAMNIVFILPAVYLIILINEIKVRPYKKIIVTFTFMFFSLCLLLLLYKFIWSTAKSSINDMATGYWKDCFFFNDLNIFHYLKWVLKQMYSELNIFTVSNFLIYGSLNIIYQHLFLLSFFCGLGSLFINKKYNLVILFLVPIFIVILFNYIKLWPIGNTTILIRNNLFLFGLFTLPVLIGIDQLLKYITIKNTVYILIVFFIMIQFPIRFKDYYYHNYHDIKKGLEIIYNNESEISKEPDYKKKAFCIDYGSVFGYTYYTKHHTFLKEKYNNFFEEKLYFHEVGNFIDKENTRRMYIKYLDDVLKKTDEVVFLHIDINGNKEVLNKLLIEKYNFEIDENKEIKYVTFLYYVKPKKR